MEAADESEQEANEPDDDELEALAICGEAFLRKSFSRRLMSSRKLISVDKDEDAIFCSLPDSRFYLVQALNQKNQRKGFNKKKADSMNLQGKAHF